MKWVKVAIGAVIAIISIGIIATSVYDMTKSKGSDIYQIDLTVYTDNSVDITNDDLVFINNHYEFFVSYTLTPETVTGTVFGGSTSIDNVDYGDMQYLGVAIVVSFTTGPESSIIISTDGVINDNLLFSGSATPDDDFTISLVFEVPQPPQLTGITATLILLTPLIFAGGVLAYLLNKQNY